MARGTKTKTAPAPEPEETEEGGTTRGPGEMHELFSDFLKEETGVDVSPEAIFLVTSKRTAFRKSDEYLAYAERVDEAREKAAEAKAAKAKARAEEPDEDEGEEPVKTSRRRAAKPKVADDAAEEAGVTPIRSRRRKAADAPDEAQTETAPAKAAPARRRRSAPANF